jgi:RNA polymerase sigma-70 factor, ECF subfamily
MAAQYATGRVTSQARLGEIVEAARAGEREAFARLVEGLWPDLVAFARSVLGRAADAEDVVQDALIVAWQELPKLRSAAKFYPWVCKIVYRLALVALKQRSRLLPLEAAKREVIHLVTSDIDLSRLLALLTPRQRAVVYLSLVEGWTAWEIGAALGASLVTVRIHRMRALARLRRHLGVELP